jgi:hypothetical protein
MCWTSAGRVARTACCWRVCGREGLTVFITVDRNLPYQQNIAASGVAVIVLEAAKNRLSDLRPLMPRVRSMLDALVPGHVYRTGA